MDKEKPIKIDDIIVNKDRLTANFENLMKSKSLTTIPASPLAELMSKMPTTHSFGQEAAIELETAEGFVLPVYPYRKILLEDKAVLSAGYREEKKKTTRTRNMRKARMYGLHQYVFCHLGAHEYYYAQHGASNIPAFGIFVSSELDNTTNANATLYDLESSLAGPWSPEDITLNAINAREFTAYEIAHFYDHDFFMYWICKDYVNKNYHDNNSWEHKREFHYHSRVDIEKIEAVIWPVQLEFDLNEGAFVVRQDLADEISLFEAAHSNIPVYKYEWNEPEGRARFSYASYLIADYLYNNRKLPAERYFNNQFLKKFIGW
jgi:hypothetical protein